ncbi:hypothetical protein O185_04980 [Photorhabdus temperata J3]|uniref:Uncharacterized protein n=1 Tax=Photorhabdus temperata J3 TaxID=1389415 RepID=U7R4H9_PHOTE|nr:hypothetical protein O185_04980 [Photorhabdus temperata J3]
MKYDRFSSENSGALQGEYLTESNKILPFTGSFPVKRAVIFLANNPPNDMWLILFY